MNALCQDSKYRDVVESYMQNRLPQEEAHSSFQHLGSGTTAELRPPPPAYSQTAVDMPSMLVSSVEESDSTEDSDSDGLV